EKQDGSVSIRRHGLEESVGDRFAVGKERSDPVTGDGGADRAVSPHRSILYPREGAAGGGGEPGPQEGAPRTAEERPVIGDDRGVKPGIARHALDDAGADRLRPGHDPAIADVAVREDEALRRIFRLLGDDAVESDGARAGVGEAGLPEGEAMPLPAKLGPADVEA